MYFTLKTHLDLDQPHLQCPIVITVIMATILDSVALDSEFPILYRVYLIPSFPLLALVYISATIFLPAASALKLVCPLSSEQTQVPIG